MSALDPKSEAEMDHVRDVLTAEPLVGQFVSMLLGRIADTEAERDELASTLRECLPHLVALQLTGSSRLAGPLGQRVAALLAKVSP